MRHSTKVTLPAIMIVGILFPASAVQPQMLPWEREIALKDAAQSVYIENILNPTDPLPDWNCYPRGKAMTINNLKMRTTLWGPPERVTISLTKNNVWDRRINTRGLEAPNLQEIIDGAYSPANKDYVGKHPETQRPRGYGYLLKEGGFYDPYREPIEYPMPCLKPVGQIIMGMDAMAGAEAPRITQSCANGILKLEETKGNARANLQYVLGMTSNLYAVRGEFSGINTPIWLRLYRHRDTAHLKYMSEDGKTYTRKGTEADKAFNFPMDPPTSGKDGKYFWIRQQMPPEKTFPQGFEYVLMGVVITPGKVEIEAVENQTKLGTPVPDKRIANAPGAAATVTFSHDISKLEALVTIVTTMDGPDVLALARQRLAEAEADGFDGVLRENMQWWNAFYDKRENGRVFRGLTGIKCTEDIKSIYRSYADGHGGGTHTDMRQYECSAMYVHPERDSQLWSSAPCYNEVFTSNRFVRNWPDNQQMWKQLVWHWMPGGKDNAKNLFGMPGMAILHGYQPPVKPDKIVHTTLTLEFCLETMAQIIKPIWDEWDYGGDIEFLRKECYPLMREMAFFYAAYAKKGDDGYYHIIPSMDPEKWGWYAELARNKDVISSLCMFRWALNRAADAAEILDVDADLRGTWREVAENIAPYPTWEGPDGPMYCAIAGVEPRHLPGDHFGEAAEYPTILADEINLDSSKEQKEMMLRTAKKLSTAGTTGQTLILLGVPAESMWDSFDAETLLNSRSGRMYLFPAVAPKTEIAFHNFQARGGFLVSAAKDAERVYFLEVQAQRDTTCRIVNPWPGQPIAVHEVGKSEPVAVRIDKSNGECLEFSAVAGKKYSIEANGASRKTAFEDPDKIDVLVVTGGLGIDRDQFFDLFDDCHDIKCVEYPLKDESEVFEDISDWKYDVLLLYNATQDISQKRRDNFVSLLKDKGIGLVVVHHAQAAFQGWHEFHKIIGTAFIYYDVKIDGKPWPHSKCKGGMDIPVTICDKEHPITRGLTDFRVLDETYKGRWWADDNHVLLTTDHSGNDKPIAWTRSYGRSRVFNIQLGHDYKAYEVPQYCEMIIRSIRWTAPGTAAPSIELQQTQHCIDVNIDGKPFTSYIYQIDPDKPLAAKGVLLTKPVLFPLRTPSGITVTRGWPFEKIEGESQDHAHHAGLYFTYDIPGNSFWNNSTQPLPVIRQIKAQITNDPQGNPAIQSVMHWIGKDNDILLLEKRLTSFIAGRDQHIIDFDIELKAVADTVEFGVTKEGMFAIRLAQWLTESGGTGAYLSSNGDEKEQGVWGKRAEWVRIQGEHNGATVGIAILNHPTSTNYPTYWHARGYGAFSANPLGQYAFEKSRKVENPQAFNLTLKKGETAPFKFRVILYDGSRTKQQLDNEFQEYVR